MTDETTTYKHQSVALGMQCYSLSQSGGVVLDGDVLKCDVVALNLQSVCTEGTHRLTRFGALDIGVVIVGDDGLLGILAANLDVLYP